MGYVLLLDLPMFENLAYFHNQILVSQYNFLRVIAYIFAYFSLMIDFLNNEEDLKEFHLNHLISLYFLFLIISLRNAFCLVVLYIDHESLRLLLNYKHIIHFLNTFRLIVNSFCIIYWWYCISWNIVWFCNRIFDSIMIYISKRDFDSLFRVSKGNHLLLFFNLFSAIIKLFSTKYNFKLVFS